MNYKLIFYILSCLEFIQSSNRLLHQFELPNGKGPSRPCRCTRELNPLCCNGEQYNNPCLAECAGIPEPAENQTQCSSGPCSAASIPCACTLEYNPVCCNGITYSNACNAECTGITAPALQQPGCSSGECNHDNICICTREFRPLCCEGTTYSNPCFAECDGYTEPAETEDLRCTTGTCEPTTTILVVERCICTREYDPICCNGHTYPNPCEAECDGYTEPAEVVDDRCYSGECVPDTTIVAVDGGNDCICTAQWDPICCDGTTYGNSCEAECAGYDEPALAQPQCNPNTCAPTTTVETPCICTLEWDPLCCDGTTYGNPCQAECEGYTEPAESADSRCSTGTCAPTTTEPCICTEQWDPVCCNDKTYGNLCEAECKGFTQSECSRGTCAPTTTDNGCFCTLQYDPICCNGLTYGNECAAECDGILHPALSQPECAAGECPTVTQPQNCICTDQWDPLCCDGETFGNLCEAECVGYTQSECSRGTCSPLTTDIPCICTLEYNPICCDETTYGNSCQAECDGFTEPAETADARCALGTCCDVQFPHYAPICCDGQEYRNIDWTVCNGITTEECVDGPCGGLVYCRNYNQCEGDNECLTNPYFHNDCPLPGNQGRCGRVCVDVGEPCGGVVGWALCEDDETCFVDEQFGTQGVGYCGRLQLEN